MKRAAIYTRVSTEEQKKNGYSLQNQERRLRTYCHSQGFQIVGHYSDDKSGRTFQRPAFQRFLSEIKAKKIEMLVCIGYDRFSRVAEHTYAMETELKNKGVEILFIDQQIDLSVPENRLLHAVYTVMPQIENERRGLNTKKGMRQAMREGRWPWKAPFGYVNNKATKQVVPSDKAVFVRRAFHMVGEQRMGPMEAFEILIKDGMRYSKQCFLDMLRKEFYTGKIVIKETGDEVVEVIDGQHEALISTAQFERVQAHLRAKNNTPIKKPQNGRLFPLRGHLNCFKCSNKLTGSVSKGRSKAYAYYHCQNGCKERFSVDRANSEIVRLLKHLDFDSSILQFYRKALWDVVLTNEKQRQDDIVRVKRKLKHLEDRLEKLDEQFMSGGVSTEDYSRMATKIKEERVLENQKYQEQITEEEVLKEQIDFGVSLLEDLSGVYERADVGVKHRLIGSIFSEKLCFDGKKYRTATLNPAIELMSSGINDYRRAQKKQSLKSQGLSRLVPPPGLEPGSIV